MSNIYAETMPSACEECPCCNNDVDYGASCNLGAYDYSEYHQTLYKHLNCPLKPLTDRLAEERKKVVDLVMDNYNNYVGYEMDWIGFHEFLDKIKSGADTNVDTKNN